MADDPASSHSADSVEGRAPRFEIAAAAVLSVAALASAYGGFQADLWDGEQAAHYALAQQARTAAGKTETVGVQLDSVDAMLFIEWLNAYASGQPELQDYYRQRFRPQFREQFERWLALRPRLNPSAPPTPFEMAGYRTETRKSVQQLSKQADAEFQDGQRANDISDYYGQAVVGLAVSLFLGGIGQTFDRRAPKLILLALAFVMCIAGVLRLATLPAIRLI